MKDSIPSIQDRLRKVAKATGKDFQLILTRYFQERLLFRLAQTRHKEFLSQGWRLALRPKAGNESPYPRY